MHITEPAYVCFDIARPELSIASRNVNQLASGETFRRATFVSVYMRSLSTDDGLEGSKRSGEADYIGASAIPYKEHLDAITKMLLENGHGLIGPMVVAIATDMANVGVLDRAKNLRMHT